LAHTQAKADAEKGIQTVYMQGEMLGEATEADREWHCLALADPNIKIYILLVLFRGASDGFF